MVFPVITPLLKDYACGWFIGHDPLGEPTKMVKIIHTDGGINGFNTMIFRMVDTKELIVVLNNTPTANLNQMCTEILHIIKGQDYHPPKHSIGSFLAEYIAEEGNENIEEPFLSNCSSCLARFPDILKNSLL